RSKRDWSSDVCSSDLLFRICIELSASQNIKELGGRHVNHRVNMIHQLSGNTVGQKGLSDSGISIDQKILELASKAVHKGSAHMKRLFCHIQRTFAAHRINKLRRIVIHPERRKIFTL